MYAAKWEFVRQETERIADDMQGGLSNPYDKSRRLELIACIGLLRLVSFLCNHSIREAQGKLTAFVDSLR